MTNLWELVTDYKNGIAILRDWLGEGGTVISPEDAQRRADVCNNCEHNVASYNIGAAVGKAIKANLELKKNLNLRVRGEKSLNTCDICSCALKLKVHVPIAFIRKHQPTTEIENLPAHCWQKTEP